MEERFSFAVALPNGEASVSAIWQGGTGPDILVLAHGAGAGMDHAFLTGLAAALQAAGLSVLRFNFPYVEAGRRMPGPAAHAIATWRAAMATARARQPEARIWAAGKSYGGRMASMAAADGLDVEGLIYLGYPLHPPGNTEKLRAEHLLTIATPQLFVEGTNDPFIQPISQFEQVLAGCPSARVVWIEGGGHSFEVKGQRRTASEIGASLTPAIVEFTHP